MAMSLKSESSKYGQILWLGAGGVVGIIGAAYISNYANNTLLELVAGAILLVIVGATHKSGSKHIVGMLRLAGAVAGTLFIARGLLGLYAPAKAIADQYTLNIL